MNLWQDQWKGRNLCARHPIEYQSVQLEVEVEQVEEEKVQGGLVLGAVKEAGVLWMRHRVFTNHFEENHNRTNLFLRALGP